MPPLVSILLPVRDAGEPLDAALASIRRQTLTDWECVAVDDGSTDGSGERLERAAREDGRFQAIRTPPRGLVPALDEGLAACRGRVVARMDGDDVMTRRRLELQAAALLDPAGPAAVGAHVRCFPRAGLADGMRAYERWLNGMRSAEDVRRDAFVECPAAHPTLAVRGDVLRRFGYRDRGWPEDYDLVLRLLAAGLEIGVVPRRLLLWRDGPGRLQRTDARYAQDRFVACKASFLAAGFLSETAEYVLWGHGGTGRALKRALLAEGRRPAWIVELHPGRLGNVVDGAPVVRPEALPALPRRLPLVVSVAGAGPRAEIRSALAGMGFRELRDFVVAA